MPEKLLVRRAAVLGAGVMGAQIAAHLTNAGVDTVLFDLTDWLLEVLEARHVPRQALTLGLESLAVAVDDIAGARSMLLAASGRVSA